MACRVKVVGVFPKAAGPLTACTACVELVEIKPDGTPGFDEWFDFPDSVSREFLAVALAAITSGLNVMVSIVDHPADPVHGHGHINGIYIVWSLD
jgi:hypothetical protein